MSDILQELAELIESRKNGDPEKSYVSRMFHKGNKKIAEKVGEEAIETVIAAVAETREEVINESADLLFHLSILWSSCDIKPDEVFSELERRVGISGLDEKAARYSIQKENGVEPDSDPKN